MSGARAICELMRINRLGCASAGLLVALLALSACRSATPPLDRPAPVAEPSPRADFIIAFARVTTAELPARFDVLFQTSEAALQRDPFDDPKREFYPAGQLHHLVCAGDEATFDKIQASLLAQDRAGTLSDAVTDGARVSGDRL